MVTGNIRDIFVVMIFASLCSLAIVECKTRKLDKAKMLPFVVAQALESERFGFNSSCNIY